MSQDNKLLITGTGRAGTTFMMRLFTLLGFRTGYNPDMLHTFIDMKCKAGMECDRNSYNSVDIVKSPWLYNDIPNINNMVNNLEVLVPIRDLNKAAESRCRNGRGNGGLWFANNLQEQVEFYNKVLQTIEKDCAALNIKVIYIEFDKFTTDVEYCYDNLSQLTLFNEKNVNYEEFVKAYQKAESIYK